VRTLPPELPPLANQAKVVWAKRFDLLEGAPAKRSADDILSDLALIVQASGEIYIAFSLRGRVTLGRPLASTGAAVVVAKLSADGTPTWATLLSNAKPNLKAPPGVFDEAPHPTALTLDASGRVVVAGTDLGQLRVGAAVKAGSGSARQPWLAWLRASDGKRLRGARPPDSRIHRTAGLHALSNDRLWLSANVMGAFEHHVGVLFPIDAAGKLGEPTEIMSGWNLLVEQLRPFSGDEYMFAGELIRPDRTSRAAVGVAESDSKSNSPEVRWLRSLPTGVGGMDSKHRVVLAGSFRGSRKDIELEGGEVMEPRLPQPGAPHGLLVLRLRKEDGAAIDGRLFASEAGVDIGAVAVDQASDSMAFAGVLPAGSKVDFGHGEIHIRQGQGGFVAALNERLQPIASLPLRGDDALRVHGLARTADGHAIVAGVVRGALAVGDVPLPGEGMGLYLAKLAVNHP
jgi:hypothetical protein